MSTRTSAVRLTTILTTLLPTEHGLLIRPARALHLLEALCSLALIQRRFRLARTRLKSIFWVTTPTAPHNPWWRFWWDLDTHRLLRRSLNFPETPDFCYLANGEAIIATTLRNSKISQKKPNNNPNGQNRMSVISTKMPPKREWSKTNRDSLTQRQVPFFFYLQIQPMPSNRKKERV